MHHFFLPPECFEYKQVIFPLAIARQVTSVLRLEVGHSVVVLDNDDHAYRVELVEVGSKRVTGQVLEEYVELPDEPTLKLTLYVSLTQREKFELILQKCTELGVSNFVPVIFSRSLVQSASEAETKRQRWEAILREAAEQCQRRRIPRLGAVMKVKDALAHAIQNNQAVIVLWECEQTRTLEETLGMHSGLERAALFIGPEGGISAEEIALAQAEHLPTATLGPRVLRVETAAIAAVTLAMYLAGEMG